MSFETLAGVIKASFLGSLVRITMTDPHSHRPPMDLEINGRMLNVHFLNTGVPHAVVFADDINAIDVAEDGAALRYHSAFAPEARMRILLSAHTEFDCPSNLRTRRGRRNSRLWNGSFAAALLYSLRSRSSSPIQVKVRGGDTLEVGFERSASGFRHVTLTGPADFVFDGTIRCSSPRPMSFAGTYTALVTPFKNGAFDREAFRALIEMQISGGVEGIVPVGTTGESPPSPMRSIRR